MENYEVANVKSNGIPVRFTQELIDLYPELIRHAHVICKDRSLAEDLTRETIEKALKYHNSFKLGTNMKAWLYRIMMNSFINMKRHDKLNREVFEDKSADASLSMGQGSIQIATKNLAYQNLQDSDTKEVLKRLPPVYDKIISLVDLEDYTYEEAAQYLQIPIGTVMSRLHRGRTMLAEKMVH